MKIVVTEYLYIRHGLAQEKMNFCKELNTTNYLRVK